jgi:glutamate/tyrosine decarboxylase-like PLP-dependent enzyme
MHPQSDDVSGALAAADALARDYLASLATRPPARAPGPVQPISLPDEGLGGAGALAKIWSLYRDAFSGNPGPRYWAFISGGVTPAALAAEWLGAALDQNVQAFRDGAAVNLEAQALDLLRQLFDLPDDYHGLFVSGGTMANFTGLAIGAQVLGRRRGLDLSHQGMAALPGLRILSGEPHASIGKAAAMAGIGRDRIETIPRLAGREAVDPSALRARLAELGPGAPIIVVANAGTVTTGDFDDLRALGEIAGEAGAYLHVDGAFGLFARISDAHRVLTDGIELADSIASDAHKFLNVPQDAGFVFTRHPAEQVALFRSVSTYLPAVIHTESVEHVAPETSRRMRGLPVWASLHAYGRSGHAEIVERCAGLARAIGGQIDAMPGFRLVAPVRFNVVCFELVDDEGALDGEAIGPFLERLLADGRLFVGPSRFLGRPCVRFAILNWRTTEADLAIAAEALGACRWESPREGDSI